MKSKLVYSLTIGTNTLGVYSWLEYQRHTTLYFHGWFNSMEELIESVRVRQDSLDRFLNGAK